MAKGSDLRTGGVMATAASFSPVSHVGIALPSKKHVLASDFLPFMHLRANESHTYSSSEQYIQ